MGNQPDRASFLTGVNSAFLEQQYARFLDNPESLDESWRGFFAELGDDAASALGAMQGPSWAPADGPFVTSVEPEEPAEAAAPAAAADPGALRGATLDSLRALMLIRSYRVRGHPAGIHAGHADQAQE